MKRISGYVNGGVKLRLLLTRGGCAGGVRAGVGCRAMVSQSRITVTAMGGRQGQGGPKLWVRTGRRAERSRARDEPATHCRKQTN